MGGGVLEARCGPEVVDLPFRQAQEYPVGVGELPGDKERVPTWARSFALLVSTHWKVVPEPVATVLIAYVGNGIHGGLP